MSDDLALFLPLIFLFWEVCLSQIIINKSIILFYFYFSSIFIVFLLFFYLFFESPLFDAIFLYKKLDFISFLIIIFVHGIVNFQSFTIWKERGKKPLFFYFLFSHVRCICGKLSMYSRSFFVNGSLIHARSSGVKSSSMFYASKYFVVANLLSSPLKTTTSVLYNILLKILSLSLFANSSLFKLVV